MTARLCVDCNEREAEFELRKISDKAENKGFRRYVCRPCLGNELAVDTTSIVKIKKSDEDKSPSGLAG